MDTRRPFHMPPHSSYCPPSRLIPTPPMQVASSAMPSSLPLVISIEGGIGVGKSTLIDALKRKYKDKPHVSFIDEPVQEWIDNGFLQGMYTGTVNAAAFQHMVLQSLAGDLLKTIATDRPLLIISERSPWGNYHVFGKANLTGTDLRMYEFTWRRVMAGLPSTLDVKYLYLHAPVEVAHARIAQRKRECEGSVGTEYLQHISALHEEWLEGKGTDCLHIDATSPEEAVVNRALNAIAQWTTEAAERQVDTPDQDVYTPPQATTILRSIAWASVA